MFSLFHFQHIQQKRIDQQLLKNSQFSPFLLLVPDEALSETDMSESQQLLPSQRSLTTRLLEKVSQIPCAGIALALISGILSTAATFTVKLVPNVSPLEIVISRSVWYMYESNIHTLTTQKHHQDDRIGAYHPVAPDERDGTAGTENVSLSAGCLWSYRIDR